MNELNAIRRNIKGIHSGDARSCRQRIDAYQDVLMLILGEDFLFNHHMKWMRELAAKSRAKDPPLLYVESGEIKSKKQ